tara:strand:- start:5561 stop:9601 length:4041 start_codon:yes stop_codon:yes gene_type:complete
MLKSKYLFLIILLTSKIFAQEFNNSYIATKLTTSDGLVHNYTTKVVSDSMNVKWIASEGGITKYNGKTFTHYKPKSKDTSFFSENIETLFVDKLNNLWIGTKNGGVSRLDIKNGTFTSYNRLLKPSKSDVIRVMSINQDSSGNIWLGTWSNGVFIISDEGQGKLIKHIPGATPVFNILCDKDENMWFGESNQLRKYEHEKDKITSFNVGHQITNLLEDKIRGRIWIATTVQNYLDGYLSLFFFEYQTDSIKSINTGVYSDYAKCLVLDNDNNLIIGTWGSGLFKSDNELTNFQNISFFDNPLEDNNIIYKIILDIHVDKNNIIWLSMAYGGVLKLTRKNGLYNLSQFSLQDKLLEDFNIHVIYNDGTNFWIATSESGLLYGPDFDNLKVFKEIGIDKIFSIYQHENFLFVGKRGGVKVIDLRSLKVVMQSNIRKATSLLVDKKNRLWIGTKQDGVAIVDLNAFTDLSKYTFYNESNKKIKNNRISKIAYDIHTDKIWVGSYNGFCYYDEKTKKFIYNDTFLKENLPSIIINDMFFDERGIWLGTPNGLVRIENELNKEYLITSIFNKDNGLKNDFICSILDDDEGNIWFSTISDIVKYNLSTHIFDIYNETDGIKASSFNIGSRFKSNNIIYFGGIDDVSFLNTKLVSKLKTNPEIVLSELRINNELVNPESSNKENNVLYSSVEYLDEVELSHSEKSLQLVFGLNDYLDNSNANYRYKLNGFQDLWIDLKSNNSINFTGLPVGEYILELQGSRNLDTWSDSKNINIKIKPAPWLSIWAFLSYGFLLALLIYFFYNMRKRQILLKQNLEIVHLEKEKEVQVAASKLKFFTNISHEFRTPLTLILGPLQELISNEKKLDSPKLTKLESMQRNTNRLLNLVNQLLDFRKADQDKLNLKVAEGNFIMFSKEVFLYFKELASRNNIDYKFISSNDNINFLFDRNQMEIVLSNLLSNAFKNTIAGCEISLIITKQNGYAFIKVKDSGIGISSDEKDKIFDRFYQVKDAESSKIVGSGIGLAFSKKIVELHHGEIDVKSIINKGSEFIIKLPLSPNYSERHLAKKSVNTNLIDNYEVDFSIDNVVPNTNEKQLETILVVEDNQEIQSYIKSIFDVEYKVLVASDGEGGCKIAVKEVPDIIISDVMMPKKDGLQLCKELKTHMSTSHIPIIILTARTATVYEIEGLKNGADAYVTKPFNPELIKARVKSILKIRGKIREHYQKQVRFGSTIPNLDLEETPDNKFISELIIFVEDNIRNVNFGPDDLREKLFMSQSTLYRKLKSITGLSPSGFIRSIRLKKAAELILKEDYKLSYIAYEFGFNDYKYFRVSFKKQFNCLPSEYKKMAYASENKS